MRRVLFVSYEYPPLGGGVGTATFHLLKEFVGYEDMQVTAITSSLNNKFETKQLYPNVVMHRVPVGHKSDKSLHHQTPWNMVLFTINTLRQVHRLLSKRERYDLAHYFGFPGALPGWLYRQQLPYIISLRGVDVPGYNRKFSALYSLYTPLTKLTWPAAQAIVVNSSHLKQLAKRNLPNLQCQVIFNGVDTESFKPSKDKFDTFTITAGGTVMGSKKRLNVLIEAFVLFHRNYPDSQLLLIGDGDQRVGLEVLVKELSIVQAVKFVGRRDKQWIAENLPKCHVFCLPSENEGMSNALLEAMASGLPVVVSEAAGSEELVGSEYPYRFARPKAAQLAAAFDELASDASVANKLSQQLRDKASQLSWSQTAGEYVKMYGSLL